MRTSPFQIWSYPRLSHWAKRWKHLNHGMPYLESLVCLVCRQVDRPTSSIRSACPLHEARHLNRGKDLVVGVDELGNKGKTKPARHKVLYTYPSSWWAVSTFLSTLIAWRFHLLLWSIVNFFSLLCFNWYLTWPYVAVLLESVLGKWSYFEPEFCLVFCFDDT